VVGTPRIASGVLRAMKVLLAVASAVVLVASCTGTKEESPSPSSPAGSSSAGPTPSATPSARFVTNYASFANGLEAAGHTLRIQRPTGLEDAFGVPGRAVFFDGNQVLAFEYPTRSAFEKLRSSVNKRGDMVGPTIIDWGRPHLYGAGRLVVVYLGSRQLTIGTLEQLLGSQFAGV